MSAVILSIYLGLSVSSVSAVAFNTCVNVLLGLHLSVSFLMIVNGQVFLIYFISSWLHRTFLAAHGAPPGAASRSCRLVAKHGLLTPVPPSLQSAGL